jgi:hypothetical protein
MNRRTTYTLLALATTALAAIAAAASGGATAPEASTPGQAVSSISHVLNSAGKKQSRTSGSGSRGSCVRPPGPGEYERHVVAFFDSALLKGGAK